MLKPSWRSITQHQSTRPATTQLQKPPRLTQATMYTPPNNSKIKWRRKLLRNMFNGIAWWSKKTRTTLLLAVIPYFDLLDNNRWAIVNTTALSPFVRLIALCTARSFTASSALVAKLHIKKCNTEWHNNFVVLLAWWYYYLLFYVNLWWLYYSSLF